MAENSLFPAFVKIDYHSPWGTHVMTIPTKGWNDDVSAGGKGTFDTWGGSPADADDMVKDLVNLLKPFYQPDHFFDLYTIYTMASETAKPNPVASNSLGIEGTEASSNWSKAVQTTFTIRTDSFGIMRIVLLDAPNPASFDRIASFDASPEALALVTELGSLTKGWSGRDNAKPGTLVQIAYTLNEKLRREYHMN